MARDCAAQPRTGSTVIPAANCRSGGKPEFRLLPARSIKPTNQGAAAPASPDFLNVSYRERAASGGNDAERAAAAAGFTRKPAGRHRPWKPRIRGGFQAGPPADLDRPGFRRPLPRSCPVVSRRGRPTLSKRPRTRLKFVDTCNSSETSVGLAGSLNRRSTSRNFSSKISWRRRRLRGSSEGRRSP